MTPASPAPPPAAPPWECPNHPGTWVITGACIACSTDFGATPPAGGPQEAAAPVEALAAELGVLAAQHEQNAAQSRRNSTVESFHRGVAAGLTNTTGRLRHNLAPAWDALAAENDRLRIADADLRRRLDDLASQWERIFTHAVCARELRDALEARDDQ